MSHHRFFTPHTPYSFDSLIFYHFFFPSWIPNKYKCVHSKYVASILYGDCFVKHKKMSRRVEKQKKHTSNFFLSGCSHHPVDVGDNFSSFSLSQKGCVFCIIFVCLNFLCWELRKKCWLFRTASCVLSFRRSWIPDEKAVPGWVDVRLEFRGIEIRYPF